MREQPRPGRILVFLPEVALHVVKLACERPDQVGSSLSQCGCPELARKLTADGLVSSISAETIRRILQSHKLKPWRHHLWLSAKVPHDEHFAQQIQELVELYTRRGRFPRFGISLSYSVKLGSAMSDTDREADENSLFTGEMPSLCHNN